MFVTGPEVIKAVTSEDVSMEDLGGAMTHNARSGVAHFAVRDDADAIRAREAAAVVHARQLGRGSAAACVLGSDRPPRTGTGDDRAGVGRQAVRHEGCRPKGRGRR
jgi:propionyl-CoA carboxylase beta chain